MRVGIGNDIHRLQSGLPLTIGGELIPSSHGTIAHSDGDVLIHAICDSIYGALNIGDIGAFFPPSNQEYKNAKSTLFLNHAKEQLAAHKQQIINIDATIITEEPKLNPHIQSIKDNLSILLDTPHISLKAKTNEGLGEIGKKEAISAWVIVLIDDEK